jgi:hypothetical protein
VATRSGLEDCAGAVEDDHGPFVAQRIADGLAGLARARFADAQKVTFSGVCHQLIRRGGVRRKEGVAREEAARVASVGMARGTSVDGIL